MGALYQISGKKYYTHKKMERVWYILKGLKINIKIINYILVKADPKYLQLSKLSGSTHNKPNHLIKDNKFTLTNSKKLRSFQ